MLIQLSAHKRLHSISRAFLKLMAAGAWEVPMKCNGVRDRLTEFVTYGQLNGVAS
jgi:hypothetical protein